MSSGKHAFKQQQGFSLVELMIAVVLGLLLTAAVLNTFLSMKRTYTFTEEFSRVQENGRFSIEFLARDIRGAGNFGCLSGSFDESKVENDLNDESNAGWDLSNPVIGYDNVDASFSIYSDVVEGTDVLAIKTLDNGSVPLVAPYSNSNQMFVDRDINYQCSSAGDDPDCLIGQILMVTDCSQATIFQATNATDQSGQSRVNVVHSSAGFTPGNKPSIFDNEYGEGAFIARFSSYAYYIRNNSAGVPSLYRSRLSATASTASLQAEELVEGIEDMQILYGVDQNGDKVADYYVTAAVIDSTAGISMDDVVGVDISLLVTSIGDNLTETPTSTALPGTGITTQIDRKLRKVFRTKIAIRNRLN